MVGVGAVSMRPVEDRMVLPALVVVPLAVDRADQHGGEQQYGDEVGECMQEELDLRDARHV